MAEIIKKCQEKKKYCGICGEAASTPEMAKFLTGCGIESLSVNPDSVVKTILAITNKK
ncbi:hypothetical protein KKA09_03535 [Patescibacteria group bacterium]|nr:hypothetical protein [Patescibacteria group bacterium]